METRASYLIVGVFVLFLAAAGAGFSVWLAKTDIDQQYDLYDIVFQGSVSGLQNSSQVYYRGVPVGRVRSIKINREDIAEIVARVEVDAGTPIRVDTGAGLIPQGITGFMNIEFKGGSHNSPMLESDSDRPPRITADASPIEAVYESVPELLARGVSVMEQMVILLSEENLANVTEILSRLHDVLAALADNTGNLDSVLAGAAGTAESIDDVVVDFQKLMTNLNRITEGLDTELATLVENGQTTMSEVEKTANAVRNLTWRADRLLANVDDPLTDLSNSGLYEFGELVREMRALTATLTRISKDFERDPTGFVFGGSRRGFTP